MIQTRFVTGNIDFRQEVYLTLLRTTNLSCPYSRNNLLAARMNGFEYLEEFESFSGLHWSHGLPLRKEHSLGNRNLLPIESSIREIVNWYIECGRFENFVTRKVV